MAKKLIHVLVLFAAVTAAAALHIAAITLPVKIGAMIAEEIGKATGKKVLIGSARFNIFEGLALEDLVIYDRTQIIVWARKVSCGIPFPYLFGGKTAIPAVTVDSAAVYLERRSDNSFNISELLKVDYKPDPVAAAMVRRVIVKRTRAIFIDRNLDPVYKERIDDIFMDIRFSSGDKIALDLSCEIPAKVPAYLKFSGVYDLSGRRLDGRLTLKDLGLDEFKGYYSRSGISFPQGTLNAGSDLSVKDDGVELYMDGSIRGLSVNKESMKIELDSLIKLTARYDFADKTFEYAGKFDISRMDLDGIEGVGRLENIKAGVEFNDSRLWSENIVADAYGMRWNARVNIVNFSSPVFDIYADSTGHLSVIQKMLNEEFGIRMPADIAGKANVKLAVHAQAGEPLRMNGYMTFSDATVSLGDGNFPVEGVTGEVELDLNGMKWSGLNLMYRDTPYISSGSLKDFRAPRVELEAASRDISVKSAFSVRGKAIEISSLKGRFAGTAFSAAGRMDFGRPKSVTADIDGTLDMDLKGIDKAFKDPSAYRKISPSGKVTAEFSLSGNALDLRSCDVRAKVRSSEMSICGLKLSDVMIDYSQSEGVGYMKSLRSGFYGGSLFASGKVDWSAGSIPWTLNADAKDVKLESLKADMALRDKDVSGRIKALASLTGAFKGKAGPTGTGRLSISNGRLWQLNLFEGLGSLIYTDDFSNIVFGEGSCDVKLEQKGFVINNFMLKSEQLDLYGSGTIGFDKAVNATLRPEIREGAVGYGAKETIAMAVSGNTVIKITGTVADPEFRTKADLADVMGGIADALFQ
ncbi:MAG: AsmA family protein [Candidatus Omnitrophota bacterium]